MGVSEIKHARKTRFAAPYDIVAGKDPRCLILSVAGCDSRNPIRLTVANPTGVGELQSREADIQPVIKFFAGTGRERSEADVTARLNRAASAA